MATIYTRATKGSALTWTEGDANITNLNTSKIEHVVEDLTPQLGGDLDVNGKQITSASNGNINIVPNGSGNIALTPATGKIILGAADWPTTTGSAGQVLTTSGGTGVLSWASPAGGGLTNIIEDLSPQLGGDLDVNGRSIVSASNGNINITPNGSGNITLAPATGKIILGAVDWPTSNPSNNTFLIGQAAGTSTWTNTIKGYNEGGIYNIGTAGGTQQPDVANGNVQQITLNSALTLNAFTNPIAGQSLTLIIYGNTAYTSITSTMKFAGGTKTLTGTAGCIDILSIYYDGTNYFASLGKGFA